MRTSAEINARIDIVRTAPSHTLNMAYDDAEEATRGMSPSAAYNLALRMSSKTAVAKAVRWQRILDRDYPEK